MRSGTGSTADGVARLLAAAGLALDAYVHARLAGQYDAITATISQGTLFRVEAALAALAALLVLLVRRPAADAFGFLVAAGGLALLLLYTYVDVGPLGPLPDMYEPFLTGDKQLTLVAQAVAVLATGYLLLTRERNPRRHRR
ncbi:hypothetical protein [Streptomyces lydicus]|uniref:Uncharacterized protein n=1 Tax=Streptomyces lydicus TaxID=47763 RepID=A0A1D7VR14_9ACTN|nr:hypothetical protein [Streptomyces lydicus]AOP49167.1 hypothetical protein SL103_25575 [Streptomyces lydicus]